MDIDVIEKSITTFCGRNQELSNAVLYGQMDTISAILNNMTLDQIAVLANADLIRKSKGKIDSAPIVINNEGKMVSISTLPDTVIEDDSGKKLNLAVLKKSIDWLLKTFSGINQKLQSLNKELVVEAAVSYIDNPDNKSDHKGLEIMHNEWKKDDPKKYQAALKCVSEAASQNLMSANHIKTVKDLNALYYKRDNECSQLFKGTLGYGFQTFLKLAKSAIA